MKKLNEDELRNFRDRLELPIPDDKLTTRPTTTRARTATEVRYLHGAPRGARRLRARSASSARSRCRPRPPRSTPSSRRQHRPAVSTTMVFATLLRNLIRDPQIGKRIVPIIPDEARTFGMEVLFREVGIYAASARSTTRWTPSWCCRTARRRRPGAGGGHHRGRLDGLAAGRRHRYATHGEPMIPFYIFYSMFGFQRTGDQIWAFGDQRGRGFMMGATAGRTTLNGEGLQHEDGHTHVLASTVPVVRAYDPAFAYEVAAIVRDGIKRMYVDGEDVFYYVTLYNENYAAAGDARRRGRRHRARACTGSPPRPRSRGQGPRPPRRLGLDPAAGAARRRRSWPSSSTSPPTSTRPRPTSSSATTRWRASAGTGSTRTSRRACRT